MAEGSSRMQEGMLSLSWNNHSAALTQMLATLREKEIYTDVTLACGGKFYPVHKLVLSTCSDYFLQMFERTSCKHPIIILKDVQCREMEALLSYMYAGIVCVPQSDLTQLILVAEALQIKGLAVPDETMCTNKRLSHTWSPTDNRISPHAKRLNQGDNGAGSTQYQRYSDGHTTMVKTQTLTGIPSFSGVTPQTHGSSPTASNVGKHLPHSVRPTYTTVRYSPYPREVERQEASPKQIQTISMKEFLTMFKGNNKQTDSKLTVTQANGSEGAASQHESQIMFSETDKEILPETVVKVEVEEGTEPVHVNDLVDPQHSFDADSSRGQSHPKVDQSEVTKMDTSVGESDMIGDHAIKEEVEVPQNLEKTTDNTFSSATSGGGTLQHQTVKLEKSDIQPIPSSHPEASENTPPKSSNLDTTSVWEEDEDSSHPLDLSDAQKQHTQQQGGSEQDSPRVIKRLYDNRLKFPCLYCSYKTTQRANLTKHLRTHTVENPFSCPYCPFRAPLHIGLKEHMTTHKSGSGGST